MMPIRKPFRVTVFCILAHIPLTFAQEAPTIPPVKFPEVTDVDHAGMIRGWDEKSFESGKKLYQTVCFACHGIDGKKVTVQGARAFAVDPLVYPSDPYSLFKTITFGYGTMPQQQWMTPEQRYDVVHYIREAFLKTSNPKEYTKIDAAYLKSLPKPKGGSTTTEDEAETDFGPVLCSNLGKEFPLVLSHRLSSEVTVSYDLLRMSLAGAWTGDFLNLENTRFTRQRGGAPVRRGGIPLPGFETWIWGYGGNFDHASLPPRRPAPPEQMKFLGHYVHGDHAVMAYSISGTPILELPEAETLGESVVVRHTLRIDASEETLELCLADLEHAGPTSGVMSVDKLSDGKPSGGAEGTIAAVAGSKVTIAAAIAGDTARAAWRIDDGRRMVLEIQPSGRPRTIEILRHAGATPESLASFGDYVTARRKNPSPIDLAALTTGGPNRFPQPISVRGELGDDVNGYALDTIPLPEENPYGAWMRTSCLGFFDDGRCAVGTYTGDIWIVSGIDDGLEEVTWQRFAAGLYEPFGLLVIDGVIHVTCRDGIKRLHDFNDDGHADYYETFFHDPDVSTFFHAFCFDLHRDSKGYLYYAKSGMYTSFKEPGAVVRVAPDGRSFDYFATGFRTPNGMGMMPNDLPLCSDNEGHWIPASKISLCRKGGFYGYVQTHSGGRAWSPDGGNINHREVEVPETYDQPILWLPTSEDNSSGSQLWVDDERFGPLAGRDGRLFHSSFGKGWLYYLLLQEVDGTTQSACVTLPQQWDAGVQRIRTNPADGQLYGAGISGWQGPRGGKDGCLQRLRHTGGECRIIDSIRATSTGLEIDFNFALDPEVARNPKHYELSMWNYAWRPHYGSKFYSVREPGKEGTDELDITGIRVADDQRSVEIDIDDFVPCQQLLAELRLRSADGHDFHQKFYQTIHRLPAR